MAAQLSELRSHDLDDAIAFMSGLGSDVRSGAVQTCASLIVRDGEKVLGVALCVRGGAAGGCVLELGLVEGVDDALVHKLVDKAMLKIQTQGVHKCRIQSVGSAKVRDFWSSLSWPSSPDGAAV